jgi:hypothetical protein
MGLLDRLKAAAPAPKSSSKKTTVFLTPEDPAVLQAVDDFAAAKTKIKDAEADKEVAKSVLAPVYVDFFFEHFASFGSPPDKVQIKGNTSTLDLIVQDRSGQHAVKDEMVDAIKTVVGEEALANLIVESTTFKFDPVLVGKPGVTAILEKHLEKMLDELKKTKALSDTELNVFIQADTKRVVRPDTLESFPDLCGKDKTQMVMLAEAIGSNIVMYPK